MGDVSVFVKELKQRFSKWFHKERNRFGTLWAERFKSVLVEDQPEVVQTVAAYVDLNLVRAELWFPTKAVGQCTCSLCSAILLRSRARVEGSDGELRVLSPSHPDRFHRLFVRGRTGTRREQVRGDTTFLSQFRAFVRAVRGERPMATAAADAVANMRGIDAVYERAGPQRRG